MIYFLFIPNNYILFPGLSWVIRLNLKVSNNLINSMWYTHLHTKKYSNMKIFFMFSGLTKRSPGDFSLSISLISDKILV